MKFCTCHMYHIVCLTYLLNTQETYSSHVPVYYVHIIIFMWDKTSCQGEWWYSWIEEPENEDAEKCKNNENKKNRKVKRGQVINVNRI